MLQRILMPFLAITAFATYSPHVHAEAGNVMTSGLGFFEAYRTANPCLSPAEKLKGAFTSQLPFLVGATIGIPAGLMSHSAGKGIGWGGAVTLATGSAMALYGIATQEKLEEAAAKPGTWVRKRDFELCQIMSQRRQALTLILQNLNREVSPPCIYTVAGNQDFRKNVDRNGPTFLQQIQACAHSNPQIEPSLVQTLERIVQVNHETCSYGRDVVKFYDAKMAEEAEQTGASFINPIQPTCQSQDDYQYFDRGQ
jgi:hypothetical protein